MVHNLSFLARITGDTFLKGGRCSSWCFHGRGTRPAWLSKKVVESLCRFRHHEHGAQPQAMSWRRTLRRGFHLPGHRLRLGSTLLCRCSTWWQQHLLEGKFHGCVSAADCKLASSICRLASGRRGSRVVHELNVKRFLRSEQDQRKRWSTGLGWGSGVGRWRQRGRRWRRGLAAGGGGWWEALSHLPLVLLYGS
jgi:hypothetical protein